MQQAKEKITSFTKLIAWQKAHQLVLSVYKATESFSSKEQFGLSVEFNKLLNRLIKSLRTS